MKLINRNLTLLLCLGLAVWGCQTFRPAPLATEADDLGGARWQPDPARMDPRWPDMAEWARAGVRGGIPARAATPVRLRVSPGANLQASIDQVARAGGGVLWLSPGDYPIHQTLRLRSRVVLRGAGPAATRLLIKLKAGFLRRTQLPQAVALLADSVERVGLEDLTIKYAAVDFEPYDKDDFLAQWDKQVFHEEERRDTTTFVHSLALARATDCWVDNCHILWAGAHPVSISRCHHITMRRNLIDRAYVKKDGMHGGYYGCFASTHCLFYQETVRRIRHFALMLPGCKYNVVYRCNFETDVNFHDRDDGHNLVEQTRIHTPVWHSWHAVAAGAKGQHRPPGPGNVLFNNDVNAKGLANAYHRNIPNQAGVVFVVADQFDAPVVAARPDLPAPQFGTFYAVRRK
jgi:hypothetical protein